VGQPEQVVKLLTNPLTKGNTMSPILDTTKGRFYRKGDVFTTGKSGITGTIAEIVSIRPNLTKLGLNTENGLRWAMVKIGA
jgi:hypothetical protein